MKKVKAEATGNIIEAAPHPTRVVQAVAAPEGPDHETLLNELQELLWTKKQIVLTGAPGTGKTYLAKELAARILGIPLDALKHDKVLPEQYEFRQFHPGYDYSDFVEGLKPVTTDDGTAYFKRMDGTFMAFCKKAEKAIKEDLERATIADSDADAQDVIDGACKKFPYVMVIDEINRADLSRVFGELFYGLEKDYRGETIPTQYDYMSNEDMSNEAFSIPPNVYIIGTMNDIDRSVESMDFALRRRFAWQEITIRDSECILDSIGDPELRIRALEVMNRVNDEIIDKKLDLPAAYYLGAAYYKDVENYVNDDKETADVTEWEMLWEYSISVILTEV